MATTELDPTAPRAFITYSWDGDAHKEWVKQLASRLRTDGVDVTLDRWHAAPGDRIQEFMERAVRENDFVIAVCTPRFKERSDGRGGGVGYEGDIITAYAFEGEDKKKFIPVLRRGSWREAAPTWLMGRVKIDLSGDPYSESEYDELLRTLLDEREKAPPLGDRRKFGDKRGSQASPSPAPVALPAGSSSPQHQSSGMPPVIPEFTVFLSSPSDVASERQIVKRAIQEINADSAWQNRCVLKPLAYEDDVPSQMGRSAQRVVDDFMRKSCKADIVVCIFCNRMGTPTVDERTGQEYLSGTHHEFDSAYNNGGGVAPRILLFLGSRDFPDESSDDAHDQYNAARKFKKHIKSCTEYDGLFFEYRELSQLESLVRIHLKQHLDQILAATPAPVGARPAPPGPPPGLRAYLGQLAENYRWLDPKQA